MKLDRNEDASGIGKYILINTRKFKKMPITAQELAAAILADPHCVEFGEVGSRNEFFAIKLKDIHATPALTSYAMSARLKDPEYGAEVLALTERSGTKSRYCKFPD